MKRLLALVLALALCVTLFAFAETAPEEPELVASPSVEEEYDSLLDAVITRACPHTYTRTYNEEAPDAGEYTDNGDGTHTYTGAYWQVRQCTGCGVEIERVLVEDESYTEPHILDLNLGIDGSDICRKCGVAVCQHTGGKRTVYSHPNGEWGGDEYTSNGDGTHQYSGPCKVYTICTVCYMRISEEPEAERTITEPCVLDENGVCLECKGTPDCQHEHRIEEYVRIMDDTPEDTEYTDNGNGTHTYSSNCFVDTFCVDCGADLTNTDLADVGYLEKVTYTQPHDFSHGSMCIYCGAHSPYACKHQWETLREYDFETYEKLGDDFMHEKVVTHVRDVRCKVCAMEETQRVSEETVFEPHTLVEGQCACGYGCEHEWDVVDQYTVTEYNKYNGYDDAAQHEKTVTQMEDRVCALCGMEANGCFVGEEVAMEPHKLLQNRCACGYGCEHEWVTENTYDVIEYNWTEDDAHEKVVTTYKVSTCKFCGKSELPRDEEIGRKSTVEPHDLSVEEIVDGFSYEPLDEQQHEKVAHIRDQKTCGECGALIQDFRTVEDTEPHTFENGECSLCKYKQTTVTPTPTPVVTEAPEATPTPTPVVTEAPEATPTPTPVVTEAPEATPTPTPVVTEAPEATPTPTPVVTEAPEATPTPTPVATEAPEPTMPVVSDEPIATPTPTPRPSDEPQEEGSAQDATEEAPQATVEILKAPELLSSDEAAAFNALGLRERMLSLLAAVGYEDQVDAALTASGEQLSQAAIAAREQLAQRIAAMDEAQKSEFDAWMMASFEPATVEVAGMTYDTLLLEVVRVEGDSVEVRRYGFLDGDVWSFGERPLTAEEIAAAQNGLNARGYDCGVADGIAGPNTEAAARAFQGDNGLAQTGKLTYETRKALAQA